MIATAGADGRFTTFKAGKVEMLKGGIVNVPAFTDADVAYQDGVIHVIDRVP